MSIFSKVSKIALCIWKNNLLNGEAFYLDKDKSHWKVNIKDNKLHGLLTHYYADGKLMYTQKWIDGRDYTKGGGYSSHQLVPSYRYLINYTFFSCRIVWRTKEYPFSSKPNWRLISWIASGQKKSLQASICFPR